MPKTTFEFEVSTNKPKAVVIGPDYLIKPIASFFRQKGLSVQTNLTGQSTGPVDYIVDAQGSTKLINLAAETGAKYLHITMSQEKPSYQENINWRVMETNFVVGPNLPRETLMGQLITQAIKNKTLTLPSPDNKVYPIHVNDLAEACWQALVVPNTSSKRFLALGKPVSSQRLGTYLENLGQTTKGTETLSDLNIKKYELSQIETSYQNLNWRPNLGWQEAVKKSFQSMWNDPPNASQLDEQIPTQTDSQSTQEPEPKHEPEPIQKTEPEVSEEVIVIEDTSEQADKEVKTLESIEKELVSEFKKKPIKDKDKLVWWQPIGLVIFLAISFLFSVWLKPTLRLGLGIWQMKNSYAQIMTQNWEQGLEESQKAKKNFSAAEEFLKNSDLASLFFGYKGLLAKSAELGRKTALTAETAIPFLKNSLQLSESILKNKAFDQQEGIKQTTAYYQLLDFQLKEIQALLNGSWVGMPGRWQNEPQQLAEKIDQVQKDLTKINHLLPRLPWLIGLNNQRRTFLVLLQNNMELRPTGGFIGSFALLTFENGQLLDFDVQDVYTADGQLKGHVEPPEQIKEILGEAKWYLRDSNWNPHFPKTAENAEWFLDKELGRKVDGVIGFNLEAAKKIIAGFGEIYLADFNEKINADNVFERAEFWSENESFPGSNQKSAFLGLMGQQLFENIKAAQPEEYAKISSAFLEALEEKEILIYTHNQELNTTLHQLNWDGSIRQPTCSLNNCHTDYLHLNEANLGVNKANYFLRRSIEERITINENSIIDHQLKINYENTAASKNWPGGNYLAWMRAYLPIGTKINNISVYDPQNPTNKKTINSNDRKEEIDHGKQIIGFKFEVPIQERRIIEMNFSQQAEIGQESFNYFLYWQKQSGYQNTPLSLLVDFPDNWNPLQVTPTANVVSGKLLFNQQLNKDLNFGIQFSK